MSEATQLNLSGALVPLDIKALEALPVTAEGAIQFDFSYRDIRFAARYQENDSATGGLLKLVGDVGPLPFTAESPAARVGLGYIMVHANDLLGSMFRFIDSRIVLSTKVEVARPVTATNVISAVSSVLIPAAAYLDLIAVYVRPPLAPAAPGESALRPEWRKGRAKTTAKQG
ncbi:MAG: hypothetical protein H7Y60_06135 [Rhodospirillaceae bacterium]|nr:hypothetical protein [Rhodospirillales bacterium]